MKYWNTRIYRDYLVSKGISGNRKTFPKQWKHWINKAGLGGFSTKDFRNYNGKYYFTGKNRYFRVNRLGEFQCSVPIQHWDKWGNSVGITYPYIPRSEKEFLYVVKWMIEQTKEMK